MPVWSQSQHMLCWLGFHQRNVNSELLLPIGIIKKHGFSIFHEYLGWTGFFWFCFRKNRNSTVAGRRAWPSGASIWAYVYMYVCACGARVIKGGESSKRMCVRFVRFVNESQIPASFMSGNGKFSVLRNNFRQAVGVSGIRSTRLKAGLRQD
jgi:hypothetical protein